MHIAIAIEGGDVYIAVQNRSRYGEISVATLLLLIVPVKFHYIAIGIAHTQNRNSNEMYDF